MRSVGLYSYWMVSSKVVDVTERKEGYNPPYRPREASIFITEPGPSADPYSDPHSESL
jgi:hypothetical protein